MEKIIFIIEELSIKEQDLHKHVSTLRYTLETLIVTKLLINEGDYFLKIYYSLYKQQENKVKNMIFRIEYEIKTLKEFSKLYDLEFEKNKLRYADNAKMLIKEDEKIFQIYKKIAQDNLNIYFDKLEEFGFEGLIATLETNTLKEYNQKLQELEDLTLKKAKQLAKATWFKEYFDVKTQHTKVFKCLSDVRTWREKAEIVNLGKEYDLNYELTSSLLHFTSYSLLTSNQISDEEISYNYMLLNQYVNQITNNISAFSKVMIFNLFDVVIDV